MTELEYATAEVLNLFANEGFAFDPARKLSGREAFWFYVSKNQVQINLVLTKEFLEDMRNTKGYLTHVQNFVRIQAARFGTSAPIGYLCRCGMPVSVTLEWPIERCQNTTLVYQVARLDSHEVANVGVFTDYFDQQEYKGRPFDRMRDAVNSIRTAIDLKAISLFPAEKHPAEFQEVGRKEPVAPAKATQPELLRFLAKKAWFLGFMQGDQHSKVFVPDPWDAAYLVVREDDLVRAAQVLAAAHILELLGDKRYVVAGPDLLTCGGIESIEERVSMIGKKKEDERPASVTIHYNLIGTHAKVNVDSTDNSVTVNVTADELFAKLSNHITSSVDDDVSRRQLLESVEAMRSSRGKPGFLESYQRFIAIAANHMALIQPFISALTAMLSQ